jgi:hypothetical protein
MSYKVRKLVVGKGRTLSNEEKGEWLKEYCELEIDIPDEHDLSAAKENADCLLNEWLGIAQPAGVQKKQEKAWNPDAIKWEKAQGSKGEYEKSEDVNSLDFKNLIKDLNAHGGKLYQDGWFMWLYKNGATVGRKLKGKAKAPASPEAPKVAPPPVAMRTIEDIKKTFPKDLADLLSFEEKENSIIIKPRQFLGSENFSKIADIVKQQGGEYISTGKNSHFKIPLKTS